jgi:hypothetical protein
MKPPKRNREFRNTVLVILAALVPPAIAFYLAVVSAVFPAPGIGVVMNLLCWPVWVTGGMHSDIALPIMLLVVWAGWGLLGMAVLSLFKLTHHCPRCKIDKRPRYLYDRRVILTGRLRLRTTTGRRTDRRADPATTASPDAARADTMPPHAERRSEPIPRNSAGLTDKPTPDSGG